MNSQDSVGHYAMRCRRPALGWLWFLLLIMSTNIPVLTHLVPKESTKKIDLVKIHASSGLRLPLARAFAMCSLLKTKPP